MPGLGEHKMKADVFISDICCNSSKRKVTDGTLGPIYNYKERRIGRTNSFSLPARTVQQVLP